MRGCTRTNRRTWVAGAWRFGNRSVAERLADALTVNCQTIGYLERGEDDPSLELVLRIAEHVGPAGGGDLQPSAVRADVAAAVSQIERR